MRTRLLLLVACVGVVGCASNYQMHRVASAPTSERVSRRNYELRKPQSAFVGEAVVSLKDYVVLTRKGKTMRPSIGFRVKKLDTGWYAMAADQDYPVIADVSIGGANYSVVDFSLEGGRPTPIAVLVGADGTVYPNIFFPFTNGTGSVLKGGATFEPPTGITFRPGADVIAVDKKASFRNFELVYGGTDGKSFTLSYREYSPDDLIRPAFTQTLTYERGSTNVRFRDVQIAVQEATSEKITYTVLADGGTPGPSPK